MRQVSTGNRRSGSAIVIVVVAAAALSACGKAAETGLEKVIEQQGGGNVDINTDDGGLSIQTEDGSMTIDEDGNFVITDENGESITGNADADSESFNVETEDGSFRSGATSEIPELWPDDVPTPDDLAIIAAFSVDTPDGASIQLTGSSNDPESFVNDYIAQLESAGFVSETSAQYDGEESWTAVLRGTHTVVVTVIAYPDDDAVISVSLGPAS